MRVLSRYACVVACVTVIACWQSASSRAQTAANGTAVSPEHPPLTRREIVRPYDGPTVRGVDTTTLHGKVMCGYQGWFAMPGDGSGLGAVHWGDVLAEPPRATVDLWPDMSELEPQEKFPTNFRYANGSIAHVFSSVAKPTVLRHFKWMKDYGIDGVFVQRFLSQTGHNARGLRTDAVLSHCREGANRYGRSFAVMYDTSFDRGAVDRMMRDWSGLIDEMEILDTPAYQRHEGRPIVAFWGYGFGHRAFDKKACEELFKFVSAAENGGCTILLGVPNNWRDWANGDEREQALFELLKRYGDIIQPWNVGRYDSPQAAKEHFEAYVPADLAWCEAHDKDYYAVIFPGFSWTNLQKGTSPLNQIPRLGGRFFWSQVELVEKHGMDMVYVAMFDEVDEGTAIFKVANNPPVGRFATYEGLPSDHYLTLAGRAGRLLRGEDVSFPDTRPDPAQAMYRPMSTREYYQGEIVFDPETAKRLQAIYRDVPLAVLGTERTTSTWVYALTDELFDLTEMPWDEVVSRRGLDPSTHPVAIFADGGEGFGFDGETGELEEAVDAMARYVRQGGTLLVLAGGRYPMYRPGSGRFAQEVGLKVVFLDDDEEHQVRFSNGLPGDLETWDRSHSLAARVPRADLYSRDVNYLSLARAVDSGGHVVGDAIAVIGPGGPLGRGRLIYVASDLQSHPDQAAVLASILEYTIKSVGK